MILRFFKFIFRLFLFLLVAVIVLAVLVNNEENMDTSSPQTEDEEVKNTDKLAETASLSQEAMKTLLTKINTQNIPCDAEIPSISYQRKWMDLAQKADFQANVNVKNQVFCEANQHRRNLNIDYFGDSEAYFRELYSKLIKQSRPKMTKLFADLALLRSEHKLNQADFAQMLMSFVQSVPYTLIVDKQGDDDSFSKKYISKKQGPYLENIKFGVQSPVEFLYSKMGDCDTKTIFAYTLLAYFDYDVAVLVCNEHAMLGISTSAEGTYLPWQGKKYYYWESTAKGWNIGQMPPEFKHFSQWYVLLPSK